MASAFPGRVGGQDVFFSLSRFVSYVIPELADWAPLRILCAVLVVAVVSVALLTAKKTDLSAVSSFCVFLLAALLVSPKSDMHHLALLYPGAALLSLGWYRRGESVVPTLALAGFWVLYLTGTVWRTGPMMFLAIVALVFLLIRYPDEGAGKQMAP